MNSRPGPAPDVRDAVGPLEADLRRFVARVPHPAMLRSGDGRVLAVNAAWSRCSGYPAEALPTVAVWRRASGLNNQPPVEPSPTLPLGEAAACGVRLVRTPTGEERMWDFTSALHGEDADGRALVVDIAVDVTVAREAAASLRTSERRLVRLAQTHVIGILYWDFEGHVTGANDELLRIVGYTREDLEAGRVNWQLMTPAEHRAQDAWAIAEVQATGAHAPMEKEYIRKDGQRVWVLVGAALADEQGGIAFVLDISERKRVEAALRESEARARAAAEAAEAERALLDAMLDAAPVGIIVAGPTGEILRVNRANHLLWGPVPYSRDTSEYTEWVGWWADGSERHGERVRPEEWAMTRALHGESIRQLVEIQPFDAPHVRRTMLNTGAPVRGADGRIVGAVIAQMDITARMQAEADAAERARRLLFALEATSSVTWERVPGTDIVRRSDTSWAVLGIAPHGTLQEFLAIVHSDDRARVESEIARAFAGEIPYALTFRICRPDTGAVRWIHDRGQITPDPESGVVYASGILADVTDRKNAEEQAQAAQRMDAIGLLAGGVAHEINNALTGVIGFASLALRRLGPDDPLRRTVEQIAGAGERAAAVTRQLLAFGRRQVFQLRDVDITEVVRTFEPMLRQALGPEKRLSIRGAPGATAYVDSGQIEQILLNLALNARDAMAYGGQLSIRVTTGPLRGGAARQFPSVGPGPWVCITVRDDGTGMSEETRAHIFEPFFTTKPVGQGTGLGLSTVYGIVQQSNGHIAVSSALGKGSVFRVLLPQVSAEALPAPQAAPAPARHARTGRILVVDDEPMVLQAVRGILEVEGYVVAGAGSVAEAMTLFAARPDAWDLVISDLVMPGESGKDLALRLAGVRPDVPVLFISGHTDDEAIRRGFMPKGAHFLMKPLDVGTLLDTVHRILA